MPGREATRPHLSLHQHQVAAQVFRIAQESLHNSLRHAHAEHIELRLDEDAGGLRLTVVDDGVGFEPEEAGLRSRRLGLTSMEERARALGAQLRIESAPGRGSTVSVTVPLPR